MNASDQWYWHTFDGDDEDAYNGGFDYTCEKCGESVELISSHYWYNAITEAVRCANHPPEE